MYFFFLIFDNLCPKESVLKIIEMITIHCCLTLNMNSHIMTSLQYNKFNFHYPTSGSSCQPQRQCCANAEILASDCIIHFGDVGVG